ncbi:glutathione reductase [Leuconostoc litchii]|uniref:NAD(P)/FAD-dependent oxidoreductase n=1 Tax=Leuconostoc litchii TaxID=1981069 RepID=A0A6P2CS81_9LACO|nr:NAD(P)/FAD-dependent oxidoreductase [Leuconostoc litchii]TYC47137.1 NAD(P)/FAD-dependent oxidoreductase [Leuconostoc litchii]GMA69096.1 glutathione reductase [Leuconostoc litchii]
MTRQYDYDVLYLGSGHGTFDGAVPLAQTGSKVGVIEKDMIGGTCPNFGCNAKIALDAPVTLLRKAERFDNVVAGSLALNWKENIAYKQHVIEDLPDMITGLIEGAGIDIIHGTGVFQDRHTILVNGQQKTAENIVISTGLRPHRLDIPGSELAHDSREFMNLENLPEKIVVVGSGYISMEFVTMANAAGADVTVLMHGDSTLKDFYQPYVSKIIDDLKGRGVKFIKNANITSFETLNGQTVVHYGENKQLIADWILDATGRVPNVEHIGLPEIGIDYNDKGIVVNEYLQTNIDNIYASGDVIDKKQPKLTPTAIFESLYLSKQFAGQSNEPIKYPVIPSVVFTSPRIAKVGISVEDAKKNNDHIQQNQLVDDWYRQVNHERISENTLIFDDDHRLIGATEVSEQADNAIDTLLPAIEFKFSKEDVSRVIHLFPSISASTWGLL